MLSYLVQVILLLVTGWLTISVRRRKLVGCCLAPFAVTGPQWKAQSQKEVALQ